MSTQTHSPGYVIVARRPTRKDGEVITALFVSASTLTVTQTSHSTFGTITDLKLPPRSFYEL